MEGNNKQIRRLTIAIIVLAVILLVSTIISFNTSTLVSANDTTLHKMNETIAKMSDTTPSNTPVHDTAKVPENSSAVEEPTSYTQEELIKMLTSGKFEDLLTVTTYPESTESQLLFIAAYCTRSDLVSDETSVIQLASVLIDHPNATTAVMSTLAQCKSQLVWLLVAQSELCSENTLTILVSNYSGNYYSSNNDDILVSVAIAILENPATTEQIIDELEQNSNGLVEHVLDIRFGRITD